jgi:hypothetical protein
MSVFACFRPNRRLSGYSRSRLCRRPHRSPEGVAFSRCVVTSSSSRSLYVHGGQWRSSSTPPTLHATLTPERFLINMHIHYNCKKFLICVSTIAHAWKFMQVLIESRYWTNFGSVYIACLIAVLIHFNRQSNCQVEK